MLTTPLIQKKNPKSIPLPINLIWVKCAANHNLKLILLRAQPPYLSLVPFWKAHHKKENTVSFCVRNLTKQEILKLFFSIIDDIFGIDEMTIYQGEWNDKVYAVAGDVLDGVSFSLFLK